MDLSRSFDAGSTTPPVFIEVKGETTIVITDSAEKKMSNHRDSMKYYVGEVRCGSQVANLDGIKATILCFSGENAKDIHDCLKSVNHPHVLKSLGYGRGLNALSEYQFLALPFFDLTFEDYIKNTWKLVEMGRFTEEFISIVSDIVKGILALHSAGFCCRKLRPRHIALVKYHTSRRAKIWNFHKCTSDDDKDKDWVLIGKLLRLTKNCSAEAQDLYTNLCNGNLKGLDVLKHSALLTVRKKFRNVLVFYFYMMVHWERGRISAETSNQQVVEPPPWLDDEFKWKSKLTQWMRANSLTDPPDTYRGFTTNLRHLIEHEVKFLTPELAGYISFKERDFGTEEIDLEYQIRKSWYGEFLKLQNFVREKNLTDY